MSSAAAAVVGQNDARADEGYTEAQATSRAAVLVDAEIARSVGRFQDQLTEPRQATQVDGHVISSTDMEMLGIRRERGTVYVEDAVGGTSTSSFPRDVWVSEWKRSGISVPEWDTNQAELVVVVVFEDETGVLKDSSVLLSQPEFAPK